MRRMVVVAKEQDGGVGDINNEVFTEVPGIPNRDEACCRAGSSLIESTILHKKRIAVSIQARDVDDMLSVEVAGNFSSYYLRTVIT